MPVPLHRIIHKENLAYILQSGLVVCPNHPSADPKYIQIGQNTIIAARGMMKIPICPGRTFRDYIAFYFGPRSIMLNNIRSGWGDVPKMSQEDIVYIVADAVKFVQDGFDFFFTDGQGNQANTRFYDNWANFSQVDLKAAHSRHWSAKHALADPDIKRKKHAEFHVRDEFSVKFLTQLDVYNQAAYNVVYPLVQQHVPNLILTIDHNKVYYF